MYHVCDDTTEYINVIFDSDSCFSVVLGFWSQILYTLPFDTEVGTTCTFQFTTHAWFSLMQGGENCVEFEMSEVYGDYNIMIFLESFFNI